MEVGIRRGKSISSQTRSTEDRMGKKVKTILRGYGEGTHMILALANFRSVPHHLFPIHDNSNDSQPRRR